ncbi:hypothetical protein PAP_00185 [Palaeococcus pacificus DY20341]|uniref:Uncharacterized protein n=1 Tax=Palaeococcus pacificus DY20341 TaxID=1343739 RepID=A0A075LQ76_9EURY|nr:DUF257 family protein [Palaeococcus pacificus]AIF68484.1 hypothetical protein PAP_00185 [Palaeococcus pacificus DY20341]
MVPIRELFQKDVQMGDVLLIEYPSNYPIEDLVWGEIIPEIAESSLVLIDDFFGVGDLMFRNYVRKLSPSEYKRFFKIVKKIKVVKIGPGRASYGEIINEIPVSYDTHDFLNNYYMSINKVAKTQTKPLYFISIGISEYLYFGKEKALQTLLITRSYLPIEDWASIYLINKDMLGKEAVALLEELASWVVDISGEEEFKVNLKKKI